MRAINLTATRNVRNKYVYFPMSKLDLNVQDCKRQTLSKRMKEVIQAFSNAPDRQQSDRQNME